MAINNRRVIKELLPFFILFICLVFLYKGQLFFLEPTFFNFAGTGDIRAHITKIELVRTAITTGAVWPTWSTSAYLGYAPFQHYPPLFYTIGGLLAVVVSSFTSYKLLILLNFIFSVFSFSFFVKRATNIPKLWARWAGVIFALSPPLLVLHMNGAEPNLLAWSTALLVLGFYCCPEKKHDYIWASAWLAITILIHPYPVVFLVIILVTWAIFQAFTNKPWHKPLFQLIKLGLPAVILTAWWWLPAILTISFLTPLADPFVWQRHNSFIVHIILLAAIILAYYGKDIFKNRSLILIALAWSCFLTWDGQKLIPLMGDFLHSSRFANLGIVSFSLAVILLVLYNNRGQGFSFSRPDKISAVVGGLFIFLVLFTSDSFINGELKQWREAEVINFSHNYNSTVVAPTLAGKRVIVSTRLGSLLRADSLVTYAPFYNFQSVTGAYSQGDPKFFNFTVHLEWEERWLLYKQTLENLMAAAAADYLYIHEPANRLVFDDEALVSDNQKLLPSPLQTSPVALIAPALLDVGANDVQLFTDIINLLLPDGYQLPLVDATSVSEPEAGLFPLVVSDSENALLKFPQAKAYLIINDSAHSALLEKPTVYFLKLDKTAMKKYFYQGPLYDYAGWIDFDLKADAADYIKHALDLLQPSSDLWLSFKNNNMISEPVRAEIVNQRISLSAVPGSFVIMRQSWWPRWVAKQGKLWRTTQGFMLGQATAGQIELEYLNTWDFIKATAAQKFLLAD